MKRTVLIIIFLIVSLGTVILFFSETQHKYECVGALKTSVDVKHGSKVYIVHNDYRPWVKLWSQSDGDVKIEVPGRWIQYYSYVEDTGNEDSHLHIFNAKDGALVGFLSKLSNHFWINIASIESIFEGTCKKI